MQKSLYLLTICGYFGAWSGEDIRRGQDGESPVCPGSEGYLMSRRVMSKIRVENALIAPAGREP